MIHKSFYLGAAALAIAAGERAGARVGADQAGRDRGCRRRRRRIRPDGAMMQAAIQKNNLMKQPMVVSLKGGASGAEALMYMKSSEGDPNKVLIAYSLIYMLPLVRENSVQLARLHAGLGDRARPVRAVGQHARCPTRR